MKTRLLKLNYIRLVMKINWFLLLIILVLFPLGQLTRLPLGIPMVNVYLQDLFVVCLVVIFIKQRGLKELKKNRIFISLLPFLFLASFSLLPSIPTWGWERTALGGLYLVRYAAYFFIFLSVAELKKIEKKKILNCLMLGGWLAAILGLIQYFVYPDFYSWELFNWDPHLFRVVGTYFDPGFTGMIYVQTLVLGFILFWPKIKKFDWKFISFWVLPVYLALALTYSRSSYLAFLVAVAVIAWFKKTRRFFFLTMGIFLITIVFLPRPQSIGTKLERRDSIYSRLESWGNALNIARQSPLLGVGFNNYRWAQKKAGFLEDNWQENHAGGGADSSFLFVLATTGIFGLMAYLYFFKRVVKKNQLLVLATFVPWLIHSFFNNSLFYPWLLVWGWIVLGAVSDA